MELDFKSTFEITFDFISNFTKIISDYSEAEQLKTLEFYIVLYIGIKGPQKMTSLADHFSTTKSNITNIIDNLENNNYVKRIRSTEDRRIILIKLTKKGERVYNETLKNFEIMFNDFMSKASKEDLDIISNGFYRIIKIYKG
ncbi:MarR family transcriptional regulator [Marinitoga sp. 38H-ov]|uniref:MarR family winged helix-turn-helix transcriptional regulator n=1 Tax=Marinitoga sp. 38H-ov TaxID=1755814 RepID=UPI0013EDF046|nr:MarR family transcriptional regulator [Marinitoga sp. 38H-ov]KAF2955544.1 MarR family transcriptional regulator [Marinitoga sp. 38H-ov]